MPGKRHTHKYHRISINGENVWGCALDCSHFMPKHMEVLVPGRHSICWKCDREFTLTPALMIPDKPICIDCSPKMNRIMELLDEIETNSPFNSTK